MRGNPKYKYGDEVKFELRKGVELTGIICIIDKWGTFENSKDASYDIMVEDFVDPNYTDINNKPCLCKHITEANVIELISENNEIKL